MVSGRFVQLSRAVKENPPLGLSPSVHFHIQQLRPPLRRPSRRPLRQGPSHAHAIARLQLVVCDVALAQQHLAPGQEFATR